jgi:hypothetical protein
MLAYEAFKNTVNDNSEAVQRADRAVAPHPG